MIVIAICRHSTNITFQSKSTGMNLNQTTSSNSMEKGNGSDKGVPVAISTDEHGYKVEMPREMSVWSAIGLGLAIMVSVSNLSL